MPHAGGPAHDHADHEDHEDDAEGALAAQLAQARAEVATLSEQLAGLEEDVRTWRTRALEGWSAAAATVESSGHGRDAATLARELDRMEHSLSWRVTAPLRAAGLGARARSVVRAVRRR